MFIYLCSGSNISNHFGATIEDLPPFARASSSRGSTHFVRLGSNLEWQTSHSCGDHLTVAWSNPE